METEKNKIIASVPVSSLPEEAEVGDRYKIDGYIEGMDGDMAKICLESFSEAEQPEEEVTEEDARNAAKSMDEKMGYSE